jgi:hypothetical protein
MKTTIINGVEFQLPFKMKKAVFMKAYSKRFGENTESIFEKLSPTPKKKKKESSEDSEDSEK